MSARARRFFGCVLPLALAVFGCGAVAMLGYAGQVIVQTVRIRDDAMLPVLEPGWTVVVNNTAFWAQDPIRGNVISVGGPDGLVFRRLYGLPGETVEVKAGQVLIDGQPPKIVDKAHGQGPDYGPTLLGPDEFFVMAEDRDFADSRQFGPLQRHELYGVAMFYFPRGSRTLFTVDPTPTPARRMFPIPTRVP